MPGVLCNGDVPEIADSIGNPREQARKGAGVEEDFMVLEKHHRACAIASSAAVGPDGVPCSRIQPWRAVVLLSPCASLSLDSGCVGLLSLEAEAELGQIWTAKACDVLLDLSPGALRCNTDLYVRRSCSSSSASPSQVKAADETS